MTGLIRGSTHVKCNKNFRIHENIPFLMYNLSKYNSHLFLREVVADDSIFDSSESLTSFYKIITVNET